METTLKSIQGIKQMTSTAYQGGGNVLLEFRAGANLQKALTDVRNKVDDARRDLPSDVRRADRERGEPGIPGARAVTLSGDVSERVLTATAKELRDRIEEIPSASSTPSFKVCGTTRWK